MLRLDRNWVLCILNERVTSRIIVVESVEVVLSFARLQNTSRARRLPHGFHIDGGYACYAITRVWVKRAFLVPALALGVGWLVPGSDVLAQRWDARSSASTTSAGVQYCSMWFGSSAPMIQMLALKSGSRQIGTKASVWSPIPKQGSVSITLPAASYVVKYDKGGQTDLIRAGPIAAATFDDLLKNLQTDGEMALSVGQDTVSFPLRAEETQAAVMRMQACMKSLN